MDEMDVLQDCLVLNYVVGEQGNEGDLRLDLYGRECIGLITRSRVWIHQPRDLEPASLDFQVRFCRCGTFALQIFPNFYCY